MKRSAFEYLNDSQTFPAYITALEDELRALVKQTLLKPVRVRAEAVAGTKLFRVTIVCDGFSALSYAERQDLAWRLVDASVPKSKRLHIAMVSALTRAEAKAEAKRGMP